MATHPDKTFGLRSSTDLYLKLLHDIDRLRSAVSTKAVQYAAFDAAVTAAHIMDWVLHELNDEAYIRLTGKKRGEEGAAGGFLKKNRNALRGLKYCRQISNSLKHMIITIGPVMKKMSTGSTVKLERDGDRIANAYALAYIRLKKDGEKIPVIELFEAMSEQWYQFLNEEGLWVQQPPED